MNLLTSETAAGHDSGGVASGVSRNLPPVDLFRTVASTLHVLSVPSLTTWASHFIGERDVVVELTSLDGRAPQAIAEHLLRTPRIREKLVAIHSGHDTLLRDAAIGEQLSNTGLEVVTQSRSCATLGLDKVGMKEFFLRHDIPTMPWKSPWDTGLNAEPSTGPYVIKRRCDTAGRGNRLVDSVVTNLSPDEYIEAFVHGDEYSVNVLRLGGHAVTLPPVWKGPTRADLRPPYRRLRLCPSPFLSVARDQEMRSVASRVAELSQAHGFIEVEFVLTPHGRLLVLELNPRISGTLRVSAMSARVRVLEWTSHMGQPQHLQASCCAAEVPYSGEPVARPDVPLFATSRATVAASSFISAAQELSQLRGVVLAPSELKVMLAADATLADCRRGFPVPEPQSRVHPR